MKRICITIDEETDNLLKGKVNKSEVFREALRVYNGDISTDTLAGMREAFRKLLKKQTELETQVVYLVELTEKLNSKTSEYGA